MANTCIVCGQAAGSGEHVFPAALGGRRTNKNIYCTTHDNGYSSLVSHLAGQLDLFNSLLGVVPDHSKGEAKSIFVLDPHTGEQLKLSSEQLSFTAPRIFSQEQLKDGVHMSVGFPNRESMNQWLAAQKAKGHDLTILGKPEVTSYFIDEINFQRQFGGPCGSGAVAYVTQTFLAQAFPHHVRSGELSEFIAYTQAISQVAQAQGNSSSQPNSSANPKLELALQALDAALGAWGGQAPVWWDFDPQPDATPNAFEFGHRVTVGIDATDGQIFGRFSLFSSIHFGMCFGTTSNRSETRTVTIDIDPMAAHPPNDIRKIESATAIARVSRPRHPTHGLATAIKSKTQEAVFTDLMRRISRHSLAKVAEKMHRELAEYSSLPITDRDQLIMRVLDGQAQRIMNIARYVLQELKTRFPSAVLPTLGPIFDSMLAADPRSSNGLSPMASMTLQLAKSALAAQIQNDIQAGKLTENRLVQLMGEGPGAAVVGELILTPFIQALSA